MIRKILVVGGGSAGFLAALGIRSKLNAVQVRVLRSPDIGVIGVGEGSTPPLLRYLHKDLRLGPQRFFEIARPTWKLGLKFLWGPRPEFFYSFAPGMESRSDPSLSKPNGFYCDENISCPDLYCALMAHNRAFVCANRKPIIHGQVAYHFENEHFVRYLEGVARAVGVEIVDATVAEVRRDERGVAGLVLHDGVTESADLYIDCSGFRSLLLGDALGEPFISYKASLFCERAIIGGWSRAASSEPGDHLIKPYTTCETMSAGWAWQIEHETRINRGYVYCPDFITDDAAEQEFRRQNPLVDRTRIVRFTSGRRERAWVGNVVAIGNAAGFVEPLEATALGVIAQTSGALVEALLAADGQPRQSQAATYNRYCAYLWDSIRDFLAIHYRFNTRLDTEFWRHCRKSTDLAGAADIAEFYSENGPANYPSITPHEFRAGCITLLQGMKIPYQRTFQPPDREIAFFESLRAGFSQTASGGLTVSEALALVRSPEWKW